MKRKPAGRKQKGGGKKVASKVHSLPLRRTLRRGIDGYVVPGPAAEQVRGIPLPLDFHEVVGHFANDITASHEYLMEKEPWHYWWLRVSVDGKDFGFGSKGFDDSYPRYHFYTYGGVWPLPPARLDQDGNDLSEPEGWCGGNMAPSLRQRFAMGVAIREAMIEGFFLALARYADDLNHIPEAAAMLESRRLAAKKGGAARRDKAAPTHKAICKRFRELRKAIPKKTARYLRIAGEVGMSERQIQRIISEKGLD